MTVIELIQQLIDTTPNLHDEVFVIEGNWNARAIEGVKAGTHARNRDETEDRKGVYIVAEGN